MTTMLSLLVSILVAFSGMKTAEARTVCAPDDAWNRRLAVALVADPIYAELRAEAGITTTDSTRVRVLRDETDQAACERLNAITSEGGAIGPTDRGQFIYYAVDDHYILVTRWPQQPGTVTLTHDYVAVLDTTFAITGEFMM
ncbi:MAG TPA: hypothetical protein VFQ39_01875 [Longimicrobium sp.]|nr:hypothetical protein [Longimicrobium sp.]